MIAACDTFRAGAVEQLRTHCKRLDVPLFERGGDRYCRIQFDRDRGLLIRVSTQFRCNRGAQMSHRHCELFGLGACASTQIVTVFTGK